MFNGNNLPYELLLTTRQTTKLRNAIENNMSTDIKLSKIAVPLMKVAVPFAKNILAPLGITAAASAIDGAIHKKIHGSGTTILIISNEEMNDITKIFQALGESLKRLKMKQKNKKEDSLVLGTLEASLLGKLLSGKRTVRTGEGMLRDGYGSSIKKKL